MNNANENARVPKDERKYVSLQLVGLLVFMAFVAGGLIISFDVFAPAPDVQP